MAGDESYDTPNGRNETNTYFLSLSVRSDGLPPNGFGSPSLENRQQLLHEVVWLIAVLLEPLDFLLQAVLQLHDRRRLVLTLK